MRNEFSTHVDIIQRNWEQALRSSEPKALESTYNAFVACACRYKHWGFAEEREIRIVVVPTSAKLLQIARAEGRTTSPQKPVSLFSRNGTMVPYLNLFEGITRSSGKHLPIKRVVVGPHPEKEKRKIAVEKLLGENKIVADVSVSAIPYGG